MDDLSMASFNVRIKTASLNVQDEMRADDKRTLERMMNEEVLRTSRYPEVTFQSEIVRATKLAEALFRVDIAGALTLNGITRSHEFISQVAVSPYSLRANGNFEIRQSDFDIKQVAIAGGALTLRDELKFAFFVVAKLEGT